jgi:uncharacterized protein YggE
MTTHWRHVFSAVALAAFFVPATATAQLNAIGAPPDAGRRTISAAGQATVRQKPTHIQLYMLLSAKGKTTEQALAKLKKREAAAAKELETLKADKKSVVFGAPSAYSDQSSRKRQIQAMLVARMRSEGKSVPKSLLTPQSVTIACTLTARWPLEGQSPEKSLLLLQSLQEKLKAADLAGAKEKGEEKLTPEEEELEEEANQMQSQYGEESQPSQPNLAFVAAIAKKDREKALADAFAKAKQQAGELAQAAGVELGPLVGLAGGASGQARSDYEMRSYNESAVIRQMIAAQGGDGSEGHEEESTSNSPDGLRFNYRVMATFQLGK